MAKSKLDLYEKTIESNEVYRGKVINVKSEKVLLPNGKTAHRDVVEHPGAVAVAAITENNELLMVKQFRAGPKKVLLEIPAGKLEYGENPAECAIRELEEETGFLATNIFKVAETYTSPGFANELLHIYVAKDLKLTSTNPDEDEFLEIEKIPISELKKMVDRFEICDAKSVVAILMSEKYMYQEEF